MKKSLFLLPLAALLATSCSTNEPYSDNQNSGSSMELGEGKYLTLNLVQAGKTRATDPNQDTDFKDGTPDENQINSVRFYFFDAQGGPAMVRQNPTENPEEGEEYLSYIDWTPADEDVTGGTTNVPSGSGYETVEKIVSASLLINGPKPSGSEPVSLPNGVVAIINPTSQVIALKNPNLSQLYENTEGSTAGVEDFYTNLHGQNFVMSNSVYKGQLTNPENPDQKLENQEVNFTEISEDKICDTLEKAQSNPLVIYVERVLARLDLSITDAGVAGKTNIFDTGQTYGADNSPIYVEILGWQVTGRTPSSRLVKKISTEWGVDLFGADELWNTPGYHRSYWAINPDNMNVSDLLFYPYNDVIDKQKSYAIPASGKYVTAYMQENAAKGADGNGPEYATKVIVAGQLVNADGEPITVCEYNNALYDLNDMTSYFANNSYLYYKDETTGELTKMEPGDLDFLSAYDYWKKFQNRTTPPNVEDEGLYTVYCVLSEAGAKKTWYEYIPGQADEPTVSLSNEAAVNAYLASHYAFADGSLLVWNNGMNYYYFDIEHLGGVDKPGFYGVVRNHIYDSEVSLITGLGTPVYEPNQVIFPVKPERIKGMLSAQIRVLQWRLVSSEYEFSW